MAPRKANRRRCAPGRGGEAARPLLRRGPLQRPRSYRRHGPPRPASSAGNRVSAAGDVRTLWLGGGDSKSQTSFPDNKVVTSKYTVWNFLPKNLFEQFRRIANFYFLCMTIIALSIESPVNPATSFLPLIFVILVTTVKQGYEDWLRHRSDNEVNNALVTVVRNGCRQRIKSRDVHVGDLVMVRRDEDVPCDLVLLSSSDPDGRAHVTTANLDGETNLKMLTLPAASKSRVPMRRESRCSLTKLPQTLFCPRMLRLFSRPQQLVQLRARIECEHPNADLYRFYGKIEVFPADDSVYASLLENDASTEVEVSSQTDPSLFAPSTPPPVPAHAPDHPHGHTLPHPHGHTPPHPHGHGPAHPQGHGPAHPQGHGPAHPQGHGPAHPQGHGPGHPQGHGPAHTQGHGPGHHQGHGPAHQGHESDHHQGHGSDHQGHGSDHQGHGPAHPHDPVGHHTSPPSASSATSASVAALDDTIKESAAERTSMLPNGYVPPASPLLLRAAPDPSQQRSSLAQRSSMANRFSVAQRISFAPRPSSSLRVSMSPYLPPRSSVSTDLPPRYSMSGETSCSVPACPHADSSTLPHCERVTPSGAEHVLPLQSETCSSRGAPCLACAGCQLSDPPPPPPPPPPVVIAEPAVPSASEAALKAHTLPGSYGRRSEWWLPATPERPPDAVSFAAVAAARSSAAVGGPSAMRHSLAFGETITNGRRSLKRIGLVLGVSGALPDEPQGSASAESLGFGARDERGRVSSVSAAVPVRRFSVGLSAPLGPENILLRGTRLRNTDYIYGCAVYTGQQTKLALNWRLTSNKFSTVEKSVNKFLLFFLGLLLTETIVSVALKYAFEHGIHPDMKEYLGDVLTIHATSVITDFFSFIILYNYIIPISLYVTIEMQKFLGTLFFEWDLLLYDEATEQAAVCNTSDLNEELGQVNVLFSDKTGTLTENDMQFRRCSVGGVVYAERGGHLMMLGPDMNEAKGTNVPAITGNLEEFFVALALCHTVQLDAAPPNNNASADGLSYQASSPDEKALTEAAARVGVVFLGEEGDFATLQVKGRLRRYRKLDVLEFTSDRKRMSVVVEDENGVIRLLCKGAEMAVLPLADHGPLHETQAHVNDFALRGLRVMMVGSRVLERGELHALEQAVELARQTVSSQRAALVAAAYERLEAGLSLLGATAVEDRLQDGVPATLESLRAAGISIWILTGDKEETAVNISFSCGHFKNGTEQLYLTRHKTLEQCEAALKRYRDRVAADRHRQYGLVVDGQSLALALRLPELLRDVSLRCYAVVCCRMTPLQKSEVVQVVKMDITRPVTAAIGDGANDVSMIQEAHVGLGVMGREGRQAARCADFAFARFRFLRRVFLVHGHWYYERLATLVQYFFYKNVVFITPQFFWAFFSAFSSGALYDSFFLAGFNVFFTSLPILVYGLMEQRLTARELWAHPEHYKEITRNQLLTWRCFACWLLFGLWHAIVIFFLPLLMLSNKSIYLHGQATDQLAFGALIYHNIVVVVNLKLLLQSRHWTTFFCLSIIISIVGFMIMALIYCSIRLDRIMHHTMYMVYNNLLISPFFWLISFLTVIICLIPDVTYAVLSNQDTMKGLKRFFGKLSRRKRGHLKISSTSSSVAG